MDIQLHNKANLKDPKKKFSCMQLTIDLAGRSTYSDIQCFVNEGTQLAFNKNTLLKYENDKTVTAKHENQKYCIAKSNNGKIKMSPYADDCLTFDNIDELNFKDKSYIVTKI